MVCRSTAFCGLNIEYPHQDLPRMPPFLYQSFCTRNHHSCYRWQEQIPLIIHSDFSVSVTYISAKLVIKLQTPKPQFKSTLLSYVCEIHRHFMERRRVALHITLDFEFRANRCLTIDPRSGSDGSHWSSASLPLSGRPAAAGAMPPDSVILLNL